MSKIYVSGKMPLLALRGMVVFPEQTVHFDIGRMKSAMALEKAMKNDQQLLLVPQKDILEDDPGLPGLYPIGTVVKVKQILKSQGENIRVLVTGLYRAKITELTQFEPYLAGQVESIPAPEYVNSLRDKALRREAVSLYETYLDLAEHPAQGIHLRILASDNCGFIADSIAQNSGMDYKDKAKLLCQVNPARRLEQTILLLRQELKVLQLESDIQERTRAVMDQDQRDYYLREQMKAIREELGEGDEYAELSEYEKKILKLKKHNFPPRSN